MWTTVLLRLLPLAKRFWKPLASLVLLLAVAWYVDTKIEAWGQAHFKKGYEQRDAEYQEALRKLREGYETAIKEYARVSNEESAKFQNQLADIRNRKPAPVVRLCNNPAPGSVSGTPEAGTPGRPDGTPAQGLPEAGRDIGAPLFDIADDADALAAQLEALQSWVSRACTK